MEKSAGFPGIVNTIDVENLAESVKKVISNAGKQVGDIQNIPNVGIFSYCSDQEGNLFGLKQSIAE